MNTYSAVADIFAFEGGQKPYTTVMGNKGTSRFCQWEHGNISKELGIKVDPGKQFSISFKGIVRKCCWK